MNFIEAHRLLKAFPGGPALAVRLAFSGTADPLLPFFKAVAARAGLDLHVETLPFNTLRQSLLEPPPATRELFLLLPRDLAPALDWRTGIPRRAADPEALWEEAASWMEGLRRRPDAAVIYLDAPLPPLFSDAAQGPRLGERLKGLALSLGARVLDGSFYSLGNDLASGCPIPGTKMGALAEAAAPLFLPPPLAAPRKVLITDLDNTLWRGIVGEDGPAGLAFGPEGAGHGHFLYQGLLSRLKEEGVLLAAVSRNREEDARAPFQRSGMVLEEGDFVAILASYHAKSAQIALLAQSLNLGLEAFVYVDDNPVELAEVSQALPAVVCLTYPRREEELLPLFETLARLFSRPVVTGEDRERTALYRRRLVTLAPSDARGGDLTAFLQGLEMVLTLRDRSRGDRARAVQLINKTNQFNLNGRRFTDDEIAAVLARGGALWTAELSDRSGGHGEIAALLLSAEGVVESFVLSCRVFQRQVEQAFFAWILARHPHIRGMRYQVTERNQPFADFLARLVERGGAHPGAGAEGDFMMLSPKILVPALGEALPLFQVKVDG
ncbi:MAG: HAD-IIIC family phosphatase [Magnetococcales bacterium]|nr:HAD-IIIC family phosphatase [Magnetococcales bacterium]